MAKVFGFLGACLFFPVFMRSTYAPAVPAQNHHEISPRAGVMSAPDKLGAAKRKTECLQSMYNMLQSPKESLEVENGISGDRDP